LRILFIRELRINPGFRAGETVSRNLRVAAIYAPFIYIAVPGLKAAPHNASHLPSCHTSNPSLFLPLVLDAEALNIVPT
jgi:hypothetical protein